MSPIQLDPCGVPMDPVGTRFYYDLVLMDNSVRRLTGVVTERGLEWKGIANGGIDPNWYFGRRQYPWVLDQSAPTQIT